MPRSEITDDRSVRSPSRVRILFALLLASISPNACRSARFAPRSRTQLTSALGNCLQVIPKCDCSITGWDVSKVRDMSGMFQGATAFNRDISQWEVSRATNMKNMFRNAGSFKRTLCGASWVHSNAITTGMFLGSGGSISREVCPSNPQASRQVCTRTRPALQTYGARSHVMSTEQLKSDVGELLKLSPDGTDTTLPQGAIGEWDVSTLTDMSDLFSGADQFNADISKWDVSRVTKMSRMFLGASSFNGDLSKWDVSRVTDMTSMFENAEKFRGEISNWDVSNVHYMTGMFSGAASFDPFSCSINWRLSDDMTPRKRILIGGGSGFVGQALASHLREKGHVVIIISRNPKTGDYTWEDIERDGLPLLTDAVINLAGSSILDFERFWTSKCKEECVSSRVSTTEILAKAIAASEYAPSVWISTSGASFYPPSKTYEYDEDTAINTDRNWASELMARVEKAAEIHHQKSSQNTRSVTMRMGIVLGKQGGLYKKIHKPFYSCLGGTFGDGSQWFPWVHINDAIRAYEFAIFDARPSGAMNVVAPRMCTNKHYTETIGRAMNRPTFIPVPSFVSNMLIGKDRGPLLFDGQHVKPKALASMGFEFKFPDITSCCFDLARGT